MDPEYVLDASALLAWLNQEPGKERVEQLLARSVISTVNLSETLQKSLASGADVAGLRQDLEALGVVTSSFTAEDAELAAGLWRRTARLGLSLADRCCLATARRLGLPALTADRDWVEVEDDELQVEVIR